MLLRKCTKEEMTIARESSADGNPRPVVRCVDAYYEDCTFYVVTYGKSNKMLQIEQNAEVSVALSSEMFTAIGVEMCIRDRVGAAQTIYSPPPQG